MSVKRYDAKRDANEAGMVELLEAMGASVDRLPGGGGRPDLMVGFRGHTILVEVKVPGETLNALQKTYHAEWKGAPIHVAFNIPQLIEIIHGYQRRKVPCPTT